MLCSTMTGIIFVVMGCQSTTTTVFLELPRWKSQPMASEGDVSSGTHKLELLSDKAIAVTLAAARAMLS